MFAAHKHQMAGRKKLKYIGSTATVAAGLGDAISLAPHANAKAKDLLLCLAMNENSNTFSFPTVDWTASVNSAVDGASMAAGWYKPPTTVPNPVTLSNPGGRDAGALLVFRNGVIHSVGTVTGVASNATSRSLSITDVAKGFLVAVIAIKADAVKKTITCPAGFSEVAYGQSNDCWIYVFIKECAAGDTSNKSFSFSLADKARGFLMNIKRG